MDPLSGFLEGTRQLTKSHDPLGADPEAHQELVGLRLGHLGIPSEQPKVYRASFYRVHNINAALP